MARSRWLLACTALAVLLLAAFAVSSMQHAKRAARVAQRATGLSGFLPESKAVLYMQPSAAMRADLGVAGGVPGGQPRQFPKQVVRTAEVTLVVKSVNDAMRSLRDQVLQQYGEINESRIWAISEHMHEGSLIVRVPAEQLDSVLKQLERSATKVANERLTAVDVTRQYTDDNARMHSLKAEEQQYLAILKQAKTVQDVLDVTEKLTDVRTSIEQLQAQINTTEHDVSMASIAISLTQTAPDSSPWNTWHPLVNAKQSLRGMIEGLGDWVDSLVSLAIYLPVIALWLLTIGGCGWVLWKMGRLVWKRRKAATA